MLSAIVDIVLRGYHYFANNRTCNNDFHYCIQYAWRHSYPFPDSPPCRRLQLTVGSHPPAPFHSPPPWTVKTTGHRAAPVHPLHWSLPAAAADQRPRSSATPASSRPSAGRI